MLYLAISEDSVAMIGVSWEELHASRRCGVDDLEAKMERMTQLDPPRQRTTPH